jgi:hypothetical protein
VSRSSNPSLGTEPTPLNESECELGGAYAIAETVKRSEQTHTYSRDSVAYTRVVHLSTHIIMRVYAYIACALAVWLSSGEFGE